MAKQDILVGATISLVVIGVFLVVWAVEYQHAQDAAQSRIEMVNRLSAVQQTMLENQERIYRQGEEIKANQEKILSNQADILKQIKKGIE
jgi:hypothetical protein